MVDTENTGNQRDQGDESQRSSALQSKADAQSLKEELIKVSSQNSD